MNTTGDGKGTQASRCRTSGGGGEAEERGDEMDERQESGRIAEKERM